MKSASNIKASFDKVNRNNTGPYTVFVRTNMLPTFCFAMNQQVYLNRCLSPKYGIYTGLYYRVYTGFGVTLFKPSLNFHHLKPYQKMAQSIQELNHRISLERATEMIRIYRENKEQVLQPHFAGQDILPISETLNREAMAQLLAQPSCAGVRIYYSMDADLKIHAILVAVNEQNEDILPNDATSASEESGIILEETQRCPPFCSHSILNP